MFHEECIEAWVQVRGTCPLCRAAILVYRRVLWRPVCIFLGGVFVALSAVAFGVHHVAKGFVNPGMLCAGVLMVWGAVTCTLSLVLIRVCPTG